MNQVGLVGTSPTIRTPLHPERRGPRRLRRSRSVTAASTTASGWTSRTGTSAARHGDPVAENAAHTLKKGMRIFVAGKVIQRSWQDNDGNKR